MNNLKNTGGQPMNFHETVQRALEVYAAQGKKDLLMACSKANDVAAQGSVGGRGVKKMAMFLIIFMGSIFMGVLMIDALEHSITGECKQCVVLDKIRPGLAGGME